MEYWWITHSSPTQQEKECCGFESGSLRFRIILPTPEFGFEIFLVETDPALESTFYSRIFGGYAYEVRLHL
jgi:hypothetical protein